MNECDSFYFIPLTRVSCLSAERRSPQPQSAQVLCACGEREGGGVDGRRDGVPETQVAEDHRVRMLSPLLRSRSEGQRHVEDQRA